MAESGNRPEPTLPVNLEEQLQWERLHHLEIWTWEEELDGKGPWEKPGEYCSPKEEIEAAKAERRMYEEAAPATRLKTGKSQIGRAHV